MNNVTIAAQPVPQDGRGAGEWHTFTIEFVEDGKHGSERVRVWLPDGYPFTFAHDRALDKFTEARPWAEITNEG